MVVTTAIGLGKGIGYLIVWFDEMLRQHYNPRSKQNYNTLSGSLLAVPAIFFDKDFIRNLGKSSI